MTRADRLLILTLAVLALVAWPLVSAAGASAEHVQISGPDGVTTVPLAEDGTYHVRGDNGLVNVVVANRAVHVESAECPDQVCVRTGEVQASGAVVACVPNGVVLRIVGGEDDGLDARLR